MPQSSYSDSMNILETIKLTKRFGGLVAVNNLCLEIAKGQICALIGPNGSGKTTVLNVITGIYRNDGGSVSFKGSPIDNLTPHAICWKGIARTFQNIRLLGQQTVFENALLGKGYGQDGLGIVGLVVGSSRYRREVKDHSEEVDAVLVDLDLMKVRNERACNLPYGKQRILEIARAMVTKPDLLLLDEPAAGLNTQEVQALMHIIERINSKGTTILLIEHRMEFVKYLADRVFVLNYGEKIADGTFEEIRSMPAVIQAYLGKGGVRHATH